MRLELDAPLSATTFKLNGNVIQPHFKLHIRKSKSPNRDSSAARLTNGQATTSPLICSAGNSSSANCGETRKVHLERLKSQKTALALVPTTSSPTKANTCLYPYKKTNKSPQTRKITNPSTLHPLLQGSTACKHHPPPKCLYRSYATSCLGLSFILHRKSERTVQVHLFWKLAPFIPYQ